jgi:preprotein translocase subunit Sec63
MTDEDARENFLKFGNPDGAGRGSFAVGIALPNFLQKEENQIQVLAVFFVLIIILMPSFFLTQITINEMDIGEVDKDNRKIFTKIMLINHVATKVEMNMNHIPGILAHSFEFRRM